jgi:hypothetical protein
MMAQKQANAFHVASRVKISADTNFKKPEPDLANPKIKWKAYSHLFSMPNPRKIPDGAKDLLHALKSIFSSYAEKPYIIHERLADAAWHPVAGKQCLLSLLEGNDGFVSGKAELALERRILYENSGDVRFSLGAKEAACITALFLHPREHVRENAAFLLGAALVESNVTEETFRCARTALIRALKSGNPLMQLYGARAFIRAQEHGVEIHSALPILRKNLKTGGEAVRFYSGVALRKAENARIRGGSD